MPEPVIIEDQRIKIGISHNILFFILHVNTLHIFLFLVNGNKHNLC